MTTTLTHSLDLSQTYPRSPRAKLGGFVTAARTLDKCRAVIAGTEGEYHYNCPLDQIFFEFSGIDPEAFKAFVATDADDASVANWIKENGKSHSQEEIILWNNSLRYKRISEMPAKLQVFLEDYIDEVVPAGKIVYYWFDVYDIEEERI
ncbi:DUF5069 domain-containing protein [Coraliomargarita sp. SDUM461004]|uniref:DUF5069 domain-containing protein n=1 Tax=Thalassobacterium sedimentorum TaxID=3041258 RepID=A0ABU1AM95_9BACT|nr:DUF5069 domain-containing protein [Coraliomargarita sp. SDUM461004]MDQ8195832.1 DUF5069 domain-containing protein [Coraliomargarita sp. SDUM461004]